MENDTDMGGGALGMMSRMAGGMDYREDVGRKPGYLSALVNNDVRNFDQIGRKKDKFKHGRPGGHHH